MKKPIKPIRSSPSVSKTEGRLTNRGAKCSTGSKGRATPANIDKTVRARGNPPGAKRS